jgi:hypothetical protein
MMEYLNNVLGNRLLERKKEGLCLRVRHATPFDVGSFQPEHSKCHDNVDRWCLEHRDHKPMRGRLLTGSILSDRRSVVDLGNGQLLDITRWVTVATQRLGSEQGLPNYSVKFRHLRRSSDERHCIVDEIRRLHSQLDDECNGDLSTIMPDAPCKTPAP